MSNILIRHSRYLLLLLAALSWIGAEAQKKKPAKFTVSGIILQSTPYCGDEPPKPEEMEQLTKPQVYAGKTLYLKKGIVNDAKEPVVLKFTSNKNGEFSFSLAPGRYTVIQKEQLKPLDMKQYESKGPLRINQECLRQWWPMPYKLIEITDKNIENLEFKFFRPCYVSGDLPCMRYVGPAKD